MTLVIAAHACVALGLSWCIVQLIAYLERGRRS